MRKERQERKNVLRESRQVLLAQTGDREALDQLLRGIQVRLYGFLVRMLGDSHDAEDVLQEVFLRIYRKLRWLRDPELFRPWAYRIASRAAFRHFRRRRKHQARRTREVRLSTLPAPVSEQTEEDYEELRQRLPELLDRLSPASRVVIVLHYLEGLTLAEVAAVLAIPLGTVKSRLAHGLARARLARKERIR